MNDVALAILIFSSLFIFIFIGIPVALSLLGLSMIIALFLGGPKLLFVGYSATFSVLTNDILLAIPLFVFMAGVLEFSGVIANLYRLIYNWSGPLRGGLAVGTLVAAALIDAMSGVGATATITLGMLALPEMLKRGYKKSLALGVIPSGGSLGPVIPPSVVMILMGMLTQLSVGKLFMGGLIPGLLITALWSLYVVMRCALNPSLAPALPPAERPNFREKLKSLYHMIIPLLLIAFVLGAIYTGVVTPTEAAGVGAIGALISAAVNRRLTWPAVKDVLKMTAAISAMVFWLLIGGSSFSHVMVVSGLSELVQNAIGGLSESPMVIVLFMLAVSLLLGCFMDVGANLMISVPIFWPIILKTPGIDPLWWGVLYASCGCLGYITPPFGMNLFYLKGIAPDATWREIFLSVIPFAGVFFAGLLICMAFPGLITWFPGLMGK